MKKIILLALGLGFLNTCFAQCGSYWGMTRFGGVNGAGSVYTIDNKGQNPLIIHSFSYDFPGAEPSDLTMEESNGLLYGTTEDGGIFEEGTLYSYNPNTGEFVLLVSFEEETIGANPEGALVTDATGKIYGIATTGGPSGEGGTIFEYDPISSTFSTIFEFITTPFRGSGTTLIVGSNGLFYGSTSFNGANNDGGLFSFDPVSQSYTTLYEFDDANLQDGERAGIQLVEGANGILYGTTQEGGTNDNGVLFQYDLMSNTFTKLFDFDQTSSGSGPRGQLLLRSDGNLYGVTKFGGANNNGIIYQYDLSLNLLSTLYEFTTSDGRRPEGGLLETSTGILYGSTNSGGDNGDGAIFEYDLTTNTYTKKYDFDRDVEGEEPEGEFLLASNGLLYLALSDGGVYGEGSIVEYSVGDTTITAVVEFLKATDGAEPIDPLTYSSDGKLYGAVNGGGEIEGGVLFEIDLTDSSFHVIHEFLVEADGRRPNGQLVEKNGILYGVTSVGGINGGGVLFSFDPTNDTYTVLHSFDSSTGTGPSNCLTLTQAGTLLGATSFGGANNDGNIFEYDLTTNTYSSLIDLEEATTGSVFFRGFFEIEPGVFYIEALGGGLNFDGALIKFEQASNTITQIHAFDSNGSGGSTPTSNLVLGVDGLLYGTTQGGGANGGVIFTIDPVTDTYTEIKDFPGSPETANPEGLIVFGDNGKLYGSAVGGGTNSEGTLFEFDPVNDTIVTLLNEPQTFRRPQGGLIFVPDLSAPSISVSLDAVPGTIIPCGKADFAVSAVATDNCGDPTVLNVIEVPILTNPTILYKVRSTNALKFRLDQNAVKVLGPDPVAFWNQVQADGGIAVEDGQIITYREVNANSNPIVYNFNGANELSLVKNDHMTLVSTATDASGNQTSETVSAVIPCLLTPVVNPALALETYEMEAAVSMEEITEFQAYPNPFTSTINFEFTTSKQENLTLEILDLNGRVVASVFAGKSELGLQMLSWQAPSSLVNGIYQVRLVTGEEIYTQRISLLR
ncbi:MAG: choice-of-anchor tandem repeat GloVer-containing protein [Bacteroidota bacterium]